MFEQISQFAEQAATNVSRRQFLGRMGRGAMVVAAASGGLLALPAIARAARRNTLCGTNSSIYCYTRAVGDACGAGGKCTVVKGTTNDCYCRSAGTNGGPRH